mmetsp:Transcript_79252/g.256551  ORF Transcript_79252/g.256551 Transcript_79252/m.256551 type:complete len:212 (-) Transcript_79252:215-850(-)
MRSAWRLCCMSSTRSPFTLSRLMSISFMLSIWSASSWRDSMRVCRSRSRASWQASRMSSCTGRASLSCSRRSQTFSGDHLERCARCSWKRHSPTWRIVSSTLSTRSSRALTMSSVPTIFFLMVWCTTLVLACSCLFVCPWTESLSVMLFSACFVSALALLRPSRVLRSHRSRLSLLRCGFDGPSCGDARPVSPKAKASWCSCSCSSSSLSL